MRETEDRLEDELGSPSCATLDATSVRARRYASRWQVRNQLPLFVACQEPESALLHYPILIGPGLRLCLR